MKRIGITGGVGSGKSAVLDYIGRNYRAYIIYADRLAEDLQAPGGPCYQPLIDLLGEDILESPGGKINRQAMAGRIFAPEASKLLEQVNAIIHPAVDREIRARAEEVARDGKTDYFFLEAALLIGAGYDDMLDELWYIYADRETRIGRLMEGRGYSREKSLSIMEAQISDQEFQEACDIVIDNSGDFDMTISRVSKLLGPEYQR